MGGLHRHFYLGDGLARVEVFGARFGAVHDGVAAIQLEGVVERLEALLGVLVARIIDPTEPCKIIAIGLM